ncbi:MAG: phosphatase PAP2 family protein [Alphaproteobacteria bacterium]|nr:phosphatase PAP2 family protein [Alphaproteobacteria bacterium]
MRRLQLLLLAVVTLAATADIAWAGLRHFDIDVQAYGLIFALAAGCGLGGIFYDRVRKDERLAAMLFGAAFLLGMSASFSLLNYLLLTVAGPRIDQPLAAIDRALGFDWPATMAMMAHYPIANAALQLIYLSVLPQIALLLILTGLFGRFESIYTFVLAVALGAAISIAVWTIAPSFGAFSVFSLPENVADHLALALDHRYARELVTLLANGPGHISPQDAKGLIGFPSYHAAMAAMAAWQAWKIPASRWPFAILNALVLVATPIQGGHHLVDVIAGLGVAWISIRASGTAAHFCLRMRTPLAVQALRSKPT